MSDSSAIDNLNAAVGQGVGGAALEVVGLRIRRGDDLIVDDFTWSHTAGRIAWVTGPNGAGKSTLMRALAGIEAPEAGIVRHVVPAHTAADRERTAYFSPAMGLPGEARAAWFTELASRWADGPMPLAPDRALRMKRARSLSTGEEKRLLLGPILARARPFIFLDEPYEHLSRDARAALTEKLRELSATSVVVVATNQPIPVDASGPVITLSISDEPSVT